MASARGKPTLLTLPRELRDSIYEHVLIKQVDISFNIRGGGAHYKKPTLTNPPSLPLVCKQLHSDTIELFYRCSTFVLDGYITLDFWLRRLPTRHTKALRRVRLINKVPLEDYDRTLLGVTVLDEREAERLKARVESWGVILGEGVLTSWIERQAPKGGWGGRCEVFVPA